MLKLRSMACGLLVIAGLAHNTLGATALPTPTVSVAPGEEDGKKQLIATVKAEGKPLENIPVTFTARRLFGDLILGSDKTLDDGTASVPLPADLPGGADGQLHITAMTTATAKYAAASGTLAVPAPRVALPSLDPRSLAAPHAPFGLIATVALTVGGVWLTYAYIVLQIFRLRKASGGSS